jgi:hypothetical protein
LARPLVKVFLDKSFLNTFLTPTAPLLISRFAGVASWCGHERTRFDSPVGRLRLRHDSSISWERRRPAGPQHCDRQFHADETSALPGSAIHTQPMIDYIFIAVIALFFVASGLYARWCEKL